MYTYFIISEKCACPLLEGVDSYFAGMLELDLDIHRTTCEGAIETEIGTRVCPAFMNRQEDYARLMSPPHIEAETFLKKDDE